MPKREKSVESTQNRQYRPYMEAFRFSAEDLQANGAGALSVKQRGDAITMLTLQLLMGIPLYSFLTLIIFRNLFQLPVDRWIASIFGWEDQTPILSFGGPWLLIALIALAISSFWWLPRLQDYRAGRVRSVDGRPADAKPSPWNPLQMILYLPLPSRRRIRRQVQFTVENVPFTLNEVKFELIEERKRPHTFYYLPRSRQIVAVVPR
jgi:hypothetical protein